MGELTLQERRVKRIWLFLVPLLQLAGAVFFVLVVRVDPVFGFGFPALMTLIFF